MSAGKRSRLDAAGWLGLMIIGLSVCLVTSAAFAAAPPPPPQQPPPPPPPPPPPAVPASTLGQALFNDTTLSNPPGVACATCHAAPAGWTNGSSSINQQFGPVPGAVNGRFGNRRPPTVSYAAFMQSGPPTLIPDLGLYAGGFFYDGRAGTLTEQAAAPLQNPNEMNNTMEGVVGAVARGPNATLFREVYGVNISTLSAEDAFNDLIAAIVAFENTKALSPFSSKYDQYLAGKAQLSAQELAGLQLFTGSTTGRPGGPATQKQANCAVCHSIPTVQGQGADLFTASVYLNTGVPKNPNNPFYQQTNAATDPLGYNPLGAAYIDYGLGDYLYPQELLPIANLGAGGNGKGDFLLINGTFKTPTLRNVDTRPGTNFVKCYGHNGFFKSLPQIVHFYNTRNLTTAQGELIDFTRPNPYAGLKGTPLWPAPEYANPQTLINPTGAAGGLLGNLGLSPQDEANLVAFLKTLSDAPPAQ